LAISEVKRCNICNIAANRENTGLENAAAIATSATLGRNKPLRVHIGDGQGSIKDMLGKRWPLKLRSVLEAFGEHTGMT
jgi:hypothetical protein